MRLRQTRGGAKAPSEASEAPPASTGDRHAELGPVLERQRAELEGRVADAERRATQAHQEANERVEEQRRNAEARVQEAQRESEERIEAERRTAQERVSQAERLAEEAEKRAEEAEGQPKKGGLRPRAARKLAEVRQALKEERATSRRLREAGERIEEELRTTQQHERELRQTYDAERAGLEGRMKVLECRVRELEATLEKERAVLASRTADLEKRLDEAGTEHAREHNYRRGLEDRLAAELVSGEEVRSQLATQVAARRAERQRVQEIDNELRELRAQTSIERAEREGLEERLRTLLQSQSDLSPTPEQRQSERGPVFVEGEHGAQTAEQSPDDGGRTFERSERVAASAFAGDVSTAERPGNGQPPDASDADRPKESSGERSRRGWRWRRRASLPCSVCNRPRPALTDTELAESGWQLSRAGGVCPACQEQGWQFPADATVPFRRIPHTG
jgi:hypothetical protein